MDVFKSKLSETWLIIRVTRVDIFLAIFTNENSDIQLE